MSVFAPGTDSNGNPDGTLRSTNIPAAFVELAHLKNQQEVAASTADDPIENTTVQYSEETRQATIEATVNFTSSTDSTTGNVILAASNDLPSAVFAPGTGGTLKTTSYSGALLELAQKLANAENSVTPAVNNINITHSDEDKVSTINATIPYTSVIDASGKPVITVTDYLG